jgi:hypothetical protein
MLRSLTNCFDGNHIVDSPARGAGTSIKPGALVPGSKSKNSQPAEWAIAFNGTIRMFNFVMSKMSRLGRTANYELSPAPRARPALCLIPGLTPRALCCRALRALVLKWELVSRRYVNQPLHARPQHRILLVFN